MEGFEKRPATQLSGGQQQRVALARALVRQPKLLLLDEPLSNLDAKLREQMRLEIKDLAARLGITCLYVTHDQVEALSMSDSVAVMVGGQIVQLGSPWEIYGQPENATVAGFIGVVNFIKGKVADPGASPRLLLNTLMGDLWGKAQHGRLYQKGGDVIAVRPENIILRHEKAIQGENLLEGKVERITFVGDFADCWIEVNGQLLRVRVHPLSKIKPKEPVILELPWEQCTILSE